MRRTWTCAAAIAPVIGWLCAALAQLQIVEEQRLTGTVEAVADGRLTLRDAAGVRHEVRVQGPGAQGIVLADGRLLAFPAEVRVTGALPAAKLAPGQTVRIRCRLDGAGKAADPLDEVELLERPAVELGVVTPAATTAVPPAALEDREITATVKTAAAKRLVVELPADRAFARKTTLAFPLTATAVARLESRDPRRIEPGARVTELTAVRLDSGDVVARTLAVEHAAAVALTETEDEALERKYRHLSDVAPATPRLVRSAHFAFLSDVSDREWAVIRDKLERMVTALERFFGRSLRGLVVEGFVVRDLARFPPGTIDDEQGREKIRRGEGVCVNATLGGQRRAVLYSCATHGVIQHECVHGLCHLAFGSTGPTWLAEGVAELGSSWRDGDETVSLPAPVVGYLQAAEPKRTLMEIAVPGRTDAGTWQDYAWRWALCHLLANNPNYAGRFKPLAIGLMEGREGVSFESVYGPVAKEISFEYAQFLTTLGNGFRSDLTAWPWQAKARSLGGSGTVRATVQARRGWQSSGVIVDAATSYAVTAEGAWRTTPAGAAVTAAGAADGRGRLVAAVLVDDGPQFRLTPEIPLAAAASFTAPASGTLMLRCADAWTDLADNDGELSVSLQRSR
jgi:hypothetical protein